MTEQAAVEYMENEIKCIQRASYCDRDCAKCQLVKEEEPLLEAFAVAIKALEKQIPKKPIQMESTSKLNNGYSGCPICESVVGIDDMADEYCPSCGQRLDWEVCEL